jgi:hypothetical protein
MDTNNGKEFDKSKMLKDIIKNELRKSRDENSKEKV